MGAAKRRKLARESTAAYSVSQPLFNALRIGAAKIGEQKANLIMARDLVKNLHVKLPNVNSQNVMEKHGRYVDCAVKAWRSALDIYVDVLENLARATAADATEGRDAAAGHDAFREMAETASVAKRAAAGYELSHDPEQLKNAKRDKPKYPEDSDWDEDGENEEHDAPPPPPPPSKKQEPVDSTPTNPHLLALLGKRPLPLNEKPPNTARQPPSKKQSLADKIRYDQHGHKILWERGAREPLVPYGTLGSSEKKAWKAEKRRQQREKKRAVRAVKAGIAAQNKNAELGDRPVGPDRREKGYEDTSSPVLEKDYIPLDNAAAEQARPNVEYEDVTAEVEARLRAKEDAKKLKTKRKRESEGSAPDKYGQTDLSKPKKKKAKSDVHANKNTTDDEVEAKSEKRKPDLEDDASQAPKKRKRSDD